MKKTLSVLALVLFLISQARSQTAPAATGKDEFFKLNAEIIKLYRQKNYDEALPLAQKAARLAEQLFGKDDLETARALQNLGFIHFAKKDNKATESALEKAFDIYKKTPDLNGQNAANFANVLETLASIKYSRDIGAAENYYQTALDWHEKLGGAGSIETAKSLFALANINYLKRDYKKAASMLERLLEVVAKNPASSTDDTALVYYRAECAFSKAGMQERFETLKSKYASAIPPDPAAAAAAADKGAAKAQNAKPVVKSGIINGKAIRLITPPYPAEAKKVRAQGEVKIKVLINESGEVIQACGENTVHPSLVDASEIAAYNSKFTPTILEGKPVRVSGVIVYRFMAQ